MQPQFCENANSFELYLFIPNKNNSIQQSPGFLLLSFFLEFLLFVHFVVLFNLFLPALANWYRSLRQFGWVQIFEQFRPIDASLQSPIIGLYSEMG